jgi:hypothetical protein
MMDSCFPNLNCSRFSGRIVQIKPYCYAHLIIFSYLPKTMLTPLHSPTTELFRVLPQHASLSNRGKTKSPEMEENALLSGDKRRNYME